MQTLSTATKFTPWYLGLLRRAPALPGKTRLARRLLGGWLDGGPRVVRDRFGNSFALPSLREPIGFHLLVDGVYEPELVRLMRRALRPGGAFVDVGANIGLFSVLASRLVGAAGAVLAVEPSPRLAPYLERNIAQSEATNIRFERCALLDRAAEAVDFYEAPDRQFGMGALAPQFSAAPLPVRARRLDELLEARAFGRVDLLKIDVEGFEAPVLRGAERLLRGPAAPLVAFEFVDWAEERAGLSSGEAQRLLLAMGYRLWTIDGYLRGRGPLEKPLTRGGATIVAARAPR